MKYGIALALALCLGSQTAGAAVEVSMVYETGPKPPSYATTNPWIPTGAGDRTPAPECQASVLEENLLRGNKEGETQASLLRDFFVRCEAKLARFGLHHMLSLAKLGRVQYKFLENPHIREVKFTVRETYPSGFVHTEVVRGLVAQKPEAGPRPWILVKCGLFCSVSDSSLFRNLLMHGFDESPFNMIVLNANTGSEFYLDNQRVSIGGFDEGRQTVHIADYLRRESPLRENISSLHVLGISKGGHAALYASDYNRYFRLANGKPPIDSVAALCPVIDLHASLKFIFERSLARSLFYRDFVTKLEEAHPHVPVLQQLVDLNQLPQPNQIAPLVADGSLDYYSRLPLEWSLAPFQNFQLANPEALWNFNNVAVYPEAIATPTLVWAPRNDDIVQYSENAAKLAEHAGGRANPNLFLLATGYGNHCGYSLAYGWDTLSAVLRAFVLSYSPEFVASRQVNTQALALPAPALGANERFIAQEWVAKANDDQVTLNYKIWKPNFQPSSTVRCNTDPFEANDLCYEKRAVKVALASLPIAGLAVPKNDTTAEALTRWLNSTVLVLDAEKRKLTNTTAAPAYLRWISYAP